MTDRRQAPRDTPDRRQGDRRVAPSLPSVLLQAAVDPTLHHRDVHVFIALFGELDILEYRPVKQTWLAKKLGLGRFWVNRCIKRLQETGYLELDPGHVNGTIRAYRLSVGATIEPAVCEVANLRQALAELEAKARSLASVRLGQHQWDLLSIAEMAKWAVRASEIRKAAA